jgi:hypothetical protein
VDVQSVELCGADVTEVAVTAFDVVEVVDVIGDGRRQLKGRRPFAGVLDLQPAQNDSMAALS